MVSENLFPLVRSFQVLASDGVSDTSDHNALVCSITVPSLPTGRFSTSDKVALSVKWDGTKREEYRNLVSSGVHARRRAEVLEALQQGVVSVGEASGLWGQVLMDAAKEVFGCRTGARLRNGRPKKWWFRECKPEHAALQAALRSGDSHAAAAARNRFNAKKRTVQRLAAQKLEREWVRDVKHNPRRFWTRYRGDRASDCMHSVESLAQHWGSLFTAAEGCTLQANFPSVSECVAEVSEASSASPDAVQAAEVLNNELSLEEVERVVRKLKLGRMAGRDGIRGELVRQVYSIQLVESPDGRRVHKHVYDLEAGSILHDLWSLLKTAFQAGCVPDSWGACFISAIFKKGDPSSLDNYRGIAVGSVFGKLFSLVLHGRLDAWAESRGLRA